MPLDKRLYVPWYRICQQVLGPTLIKQDESDEEVTKWVSQEGWMILPLPYEKEPRDAKTRHFPNIYFALLENETIDLGLVCNTIASVEKMKNILLPHSTPLKETLLSQMRKMSPSFITFVSSKQKKHFFATPKHERGFDVTSRDIDDVSISRIFMEAAEIRERGREIPALHSPNYPSEAPVLDLATVNLDRDEAEFAERLVELRPLFETCLNVRTETEFKKEQASKPKTRIVEYKCWKCNTIYSKEEFSESRFCLKDGTRISVEVRRE